MAVNAVHGKVRFRNVTTKFEKILNPFISEIWALEPENFPLMEHRYFLFSSKIN